MEIQSYQKLQVSNEITRKTLLDSFNYSMNTRTLQDPKRWSM